MKKLCLVPIVLFAGMLFLNLDYFHNIEATLSKYSNIAPMIYIVIFAVAPLTFFPSSILVVMAGRFFGFGWGFVYTLVGALLGSSIAFMITRGFVTLPKYIANNRQIKTFSDKTSFKVILLMRFVPIIPFDVISYGAGLSKISYFEYALASFIGVIPGVVIYTNIGAQSFDLNSTSFYIAVTALVVFALIMSKLASIIKVKLDY